MPALCVTGQLRLPAEGAGANIASCGVCMSSMISVLVPATTIVTAACYLYQHVLATQADNCCWEAS